MKLIYVKPAQGRLVREPITNLPMPDEGMFVAESDPHWMQHLRFGDIEVTDAPAAEKAALDQTGIATERDEQPQPPEAAPLSAEHAAAPAPVAAPGDPDAATAAQPGAAAAATHDADAHPAE